MIEISKTVDELITKLIEKFEVSGSNIDRIPEKYVSETLRLIEMAPFLKLRKDYLYFLSEMSMLILDMNDDSHITIYGLEDWDEGFNIFDYPVPDKNGFHLILDQCTSEGEMTYFSYNSKFPDSEKIWISSDIEEGPFIQTDLDFIDLLKSIYEEDFAVFRELRAKVNR